MIHIDGAWFKDEHGRTLLLRGVNLGGSSKMPRRPNGATHLGAGIFDHRDVSFIGRPFPLEEADEHLSRLRSWGFNTLRFVTTWEAIEHAGPGIYDEEYLDYLYQVVGKAGEHGFYVFIDPHQDVWSRFTGGDGAPGWTLEAAGLDSGHFRETGAALVHHKWGADYPRMLWSTNSTKLACATMFTLFFGGDAFAPQLKVDGQPIQDYLQGHYIAAVAQIARRLKDLECVIGYDTLNEPAYGWIGWPHLDQHHGQDRRGETPTPYQSMLLGSGFAQEVELWAVTPIGLRRTGRRLLNQEGAGAWLPGRSCIWRQHGVWDVDTDGQARLLRPDYFSVLDGHPVDFYADFFRPFVLRFAQTVHAEDPHALIFMEGVADGDLPRWDGGQDGSGYINAGHWYDSWTLITRRFIPWLNVDTSQGGKIVLGAGNVRRDFVGQIRHIKDFTRERMGGIPALIGEFGIPFDLNGGRAYRSGDFTRQIQALDASFQAMDANLLSATLWNYTADNSNAHGDQWNGEDLSIFSRDQQTDPGDVNSGARALAAFARPYARKTAGEPLSMRYDVYSGRFEFSFRHDPAVGAPSEICVPQAAYPRGCRVSVSDGEYQIDSQTLLYRHGGDQETHWVRVERV
jgi:hypothetical protein